MAELNSATWKKAGELLKRSKLSTLNSESKDEACWDEAFDLTILSITEEREENPTFAREVYNLDKETDGEYNLLEALEWYFNHLEDNGKWEEVIYSCNRILELFDFIEFLPSEYLFRKGNALEKLGRNEAALKFGKKWLEDYPEDPYAGASNAFLLCSLGRFEEAKAVTEKFLGQELVCDDDKDTIFMAAYRLVEMTDNINAKQRVERKMAEYNQMLG